MSLVADRALWESIVDADAEVPPGRTAAELLPALLDLLGEDDPWLRDEVGYGVLARWVVQDHLLDRDQLRYAVERLVPDLRLGTRRRRRRQQPTTPPCAARTRRSPWRSSPSATSRSTSSTRPPSTSCSTPASTTSSTSPIAAATCPSWAGSTPPPHAADLLKFVVRNPLTGEADHRRVLDALAGAVDARHVGRSSSTTRRTVSSSSSSTSSDARRSATTSCATGSTRSARGSPGGPARSTRRRGRRP